MMGSEKFCLKWNDFQTTLSSSFNYLRKDEDFCDVTLLTDDESRFSAHRLILSACSDFFKHILKISNHSHPVLYLSGVHDQNLRFILDYIYQGEVQLQQEELEDFLHVAQKLKVKGLVTDLNSQEPQKRQDDKSLQLRQENKYAKEEIVSDSDSPTLATKRFNGISSSMNQVANFVGSLDVLDINSLDQKIEELIERSSGTFECKVCGKAVSRKQDLEKHVEIHLEGLTFPCGFCGKTFKSRNSLHFHKYKFHKV